MVEWVCPERVWVLPNVHHAFAGKPIAPAGGETTGIIGPPNAVRAGAGSLVTLTALP